MNATVVPGISTLPDGTRIPYGERGDAAGRAVVLLHGLTDSWRSWQPVIDRLPESIHVIAPTLRGHGDADRPTTGYGITGLADDIASTLTGIGVDRAVVVGHSLGASVASALAVRHPDRVTGLVLVAAFAEPAANAGVIELAEAVDELADPIEREFVEEFQRGTLANPVPDEFLASVINESRKVPAHVWKAAVDGFRRHEHLANLATVAAPTLLIWGDQDAFVPRQDQDRLVAHLPQSTLAVYPGVGHGVHWEQPDTFATDLIRFIDAVS